MGRYKCKLCKRIVPANEIACEFDDGILCIHCAHHLIRLIFMTIFLIILLYFNGGNYVK